MISNNQRSSSHTTTLVVLGTTSTIAIGISLYLWRNLADLKVRIEVLESKQRAGEEARTVKSPRRQSHSDRGKDDDAGSFVFEGKPGEYPPPELELTAEDDVPPRFLAAAKGDEEEGRRRFKETLEWREKHDMNSALYRAWPQFELIKKHYPHYFHGFGKNGSPVFFEQPPKTDLKALRNGGVDLKALLHHYAMICEFQWQFLARDDLQKSIYIIDLEGMGMYDFVGDCKEFVQQASAFASAHYPERAGVVYVINVPYWFKMVWNVVSKWVDEVTLEKIFILRGKDEILEKLSDKIDLENIPQEYGGQSKYSLGDSAEEQLLRDLMSHNSKMAETGECPTDEAASRFCNFRYARNF